MTRTADGFTRLEANKRLVARAMELLVDRQRAAQAMDLLTPEYIQHNPNIPSGRDAIMKFTQSAMAEEARKVMKTAGEPTFIAEGDLVVMMQPIERPDPAHPGKTYTSYWFDMWRIDDGRLAEHWDGAPKEANADPFA
jgi:predicted SnoaL-like aldol condensation-catalyzing enzyme